MTIRFDELWHGHPAANPDGDPLPCKNRDGTPAHDNQCSIRMGVCLDAAGVDMSRYPGVVCWQGHGKIHPLRAQELADWLVQELPRHGFNRRERFSNVEARDFSGRRGVVFFKNFWGRGNEGDHIDLWNGQMQTRGDDEYFTEAEEVWFWELPERPEDKKASHPKTYREPPVP